MVQALAQEVPEQDLERAKKATKAAILMNLESRAIVVEDIGRQLLTYDQRWPLLRSAPLASLLLTLWQRFAPALFTCHFDAFRNGLLRSGVVMMFNAFCWSPPLPPPFCTVRKFPDHFAGRCGLEICSSLLVQLDRSCLVKSSPSFEASCWNFSCALANHLL